MPVEVSDHAKTDYVRKVVRLSGELLASHSDLLALKNIRRKHDLIRVIKLDLDKLTHALLEVKDNTASAVLSHFFADCAANSEAIAGRLGDQRIYHVGFEIHEPLALVLHGIHHWIEHSRSVLGANMRVKEYLCFPASAAFQKRVGAYTEIMRIWLEVGDRVLMLELFDIHRPADAFLEAAPKPTHRNFHGLFLGESAEGDHPHRMARLFDTDLIWHHALYVKSASDVEQLHRDFQELADNSPSFLLPYVAPVLNRHDGSYHTKIVRQAAARRELEFVTQYAAPVELS